MVKKFLTSQSASTGAGLDRDSRRAVPTGPRPAATLAALLLLLTTSAGRSDDRWQSPQGHGHPLAGRIWDVGAARFIDAPALVEQLSRARFILLGERHDNPDHHRLQTELLRALIARGLRPAVSFEMFTADDAPVIARQLADAPRDADALADAVDWKRSGWPAWPMYRPLVQVALDAGLPVVAGNVSRSVVRGVTDNGLDLNPATAAGLGLDVPWPLAFQADLTAELRRAHCGHGSDTMIERMALIQRARDARMARSLVEADRGDGAVLIAGAGHVRTDRGVPMQLRMLRPGHAAASVIFQEVADDSAEPRAYADASPGGRPPFDYVWFTARVDAVDPCERFKARGTPAREPH
jgi:uncharacterized iron-regulated protein